MSDKTQPVAVTQADLQTAWAVFETARDHYIAIRERLQAGAPLEPGELECHYGLSIYSGFFGLKIVKAKTGRRRAHAS